MTGADYLVTANASRVDATGVSCISPRRWLGIRYSDVSSTARLHLHCPEQARASNMNPDVTCKVMLGDRVLSSRPRREKGLLPVPAPSPSVLLIPHPWRAGG